jgi:hypothetical protein
LSQENEEERARAGDGRQSVTIPELTPLGITAFMEGVQPQENEEERARAGDGRQSVAIPEFMPLGITAFMEGVQPQEDEVVPAPGASLFGIRAQVAPSARSAEYDLGNNEAEMGVSVNALADDEEGADLPSWYNPANAVAGAAGIAWSMQTLADDDDVPSWHNQASNATAAMLPFDSLAGGASRAAAEHGVQMAPGSAHQGRIPGMFTMPPLPGLKRPLVWIAGALVLIVIATLVAYAFNTGVVAAAKHAPLAATTARSPHSTPIFITPIATSHPTSVPTPTQPPKPTPTPTQAPGLYTQATSGTPVYSAFMTKQDSANWPVGSGTQGGLTTSCNFTGYGYQVSIAATSSFKGFWPTYYPCDETGINMGDFAFQVVVVMTAGGDGGGVVFRHTANSEYRLRVGSNGSYDLVGTGMAEIFGSSSAIHTGLDQGNIITIIARGSNVYIYINKQRILSLANANTTSGEFGFMAVESSQPTTALFGNVKIW